MSKNARFLVAAIVALVALTAVVFLVIFTPERSGQGGPSAGTTSAGAVQEINERRLYVATDAHGYVDLIEIDLRRRTSGPDGSTVDQGTGVLHKEDQANRSSTWSAPRTEQFNVQLVRDRNGDEKITFEDWSTGVIESDQLALDRGTSRVISRRLCKTTWVDFNTWHTSPRFPWFC